MNDATDVSAPGGAPVGPPVPYDPDVAAVLATLLEVIPRLTAEGIPALRQRNSLIPQVTLDELRCDGVFQVEERTVPGPAGAPEISLLICRPTAPSGPVPAIYHVHGGGMIAGDNRVGMARIQEMAEGAVAIVSVEYRLAPEHPHPAPVEDCYAGLVWTAQHAAELGIDPEKIIVGGGSAGGGLTAATALLARDRGGPALAGQLLMSPMLDDRNDTVSSRQMAGLGVWDHHDNETGWTALLGDARGGPRVSPYAAPARATDLSGLPPAYIDVGSAETFRDEAVAYATAIWQAGGVAELHVWPGGCHGFEGFAPHAAVSIAAKQPRRNWLRRILAS
jgi:acetyl esterase/lipase